MMERLGDLAHRTGEGVTVAVVDSGVNAGHSHVGEVAGGACFLPESRAVMNEESRRLVVALPEDRSGATPGACGARDEQMGEGWSDAMGHGTAVAGVVRLWAPAARLLAARIFDGTLRCPAAVARRAVLWACEAGADVVLLSLAGPEEEGWPEVLEAARPAVVVAAADNRTGGGYPAALPGALGVGAAPGPRSFGLGPGVLDFLAPPFPRPLPGDRPNFTGTSFAAAHVAGLAARVRQVSPGAGVEEVRERLQRLFEGR